jgi:hypothetical protein
MPDIICAVCGKTIAAEESRLVDVHPTTKVKVHAHVECRKAHRNSEAG